MARFDYYIDSVLHRWLRLPYKLHVKEFHSPARPRATVVLIHGIGNTLHAWDTVAKKLPKDVRVIGVDLLGFGGSPMPRWATYNAKTQARMVGTTLLRLGLKQRPLLVGHSLGALVAVEVARRYPFAVKHLVLASPPFYKPEAKSGKLLRPRDEGLRQLYRLAKRHPEVLSGLSPYIVRMGLANKSLNITEDTVETYMSALESSIINQTALEDIYSLSLPISIMYGSLDPVVIGKHIVRLGKEKENVSVKRLLTSHEVVGSYVGALVKEIERVIGDASHRSSSGSSSRR